MANLKDSRIKEASSLAMSLKHTNVAYLCNDEYKAPQIFAVNVTTGHTTGTLTFAGLPGSAADPEAITVLPDGTIVLADIGDNDLNRSNIALYALSKKDFGQGNYTVSAKRIYLKYPGGAKLNAEALISHPTTGEMYLLTKASAGRAYKIGKLADLSTSKQMSLVVSSLPANISDATFSKNGKYIFIRTTNKTTVYVYSFPEWKRVTPDIPVPSQGKGEGITVSADGKYLWMSSEGSGAAITLAAIPEKYWKLPTTQPGKPVPTDPKATLPPSIDDFDEGPNNWVPPGDGWQRRVPTGDDFDQAFKYAYQRPWGLRPGDKWTGFTTRSTGSWEKLLTGFVQGLLSVMFEEAGAQWTVRKEKGRRPVLYLREIPQDTDPDILEITVGAPGVNVTLSRDFTQSANVIYGEGQDDAGTTFTGAQVHVDANGPFTSYEPFAYSPTVWPVQPLDMHGKGNPSRNQNLTPREAHIKFPQGMDLIDATNLARGQFHRFADPGFTGTVQLKTDLRLAGDGTPFPRLLVKAGRTLRIKGLFGKEEGILFHITETSIDPDEMILNLTVDSKYRDQLTVSEVRARTRDALTPLRSLQVGKYTNTVQDLLYPWSYTQGSGCIPFGSKDFFKQHVTLDDKFPYENVTTKLDSKGNRFLSPKYKSSFYIKIPKNPKRTNDPGGVAAKSGSNASWNQFQIPIRMGAAGTIKLIQLAAYDVDGNVLPVKFHFSLYNNNGIAYTDMPMLIGNSTPGNRDFKYRYLKPALDAIPALPGAQVEDYRVGQRYPFYETAWEQVDDLGQQFSDGDLNRYPQNAGLIVGWGNFFEPAGYSPGRYSRGAPVSGLLVDETPFSWDISGNLNSQIAQDNVSNKDRGHLYAMVYCDDRPDKDVYFMGRMYRVEPGGQ